MKKLLFVVLIFSYSPFFTQEFLGVNQSNYAGALGVEINELGIMPIGQNGEIIQAVKLDYLFKKISYIDQANQ